MIKRISPPSQAVASSPSHLLHQHVCALVQTNSNDIIIRNNFILLKRKQNMGCGCALIYNIRLCKIAPVPTCLSRRVKASCMLLAHNNYTCSDCGSLSLTITPILVSVAWPDRYIIQGVTIKI